jgi:dGTPase
MAAHGGFDHNAQSLRIVTSLERRYADFDGLNLTWETLEGIVKHNGPLTDRAGKPVGGYTERGIPEPIAEYNRLHDLELSTHAGAEAQAAALADDIAYNAHDLDDALRAGLFAPEELAGLPLVGELLADLRRRYPALERTRLVSELTRRLIARMIADVIAETDRRVIELSPWSGADVRLARAPVVRFSEQLAPVDRAIKEFLTPRMYRHERVLTIMDDAQRVVRELFAHYMRRVEDLPEEWSRGLAAASEAARARRICDFIAGMTDNYTLAEHTRYFADTPALRRRFRPR